MRFDATVLCVAILITSSSASARARFVAYEGKDAVSEGRGGTKVAAHGIDFWTTGDPPRKFQVLGIITDKRATGFIAGDAVGSASIAAKVKDAGGDAVIIMDRARDLKGFAHGGQATTSGSTAFGSGWSIPVEDAVTRMMVVKYLAPE